MEDYHVSPSSPPSAAHLYSEPSLPSTVCMSTPYISRFFALLRNESSAWAGVWFLEYNFNYGKMGRHGSAAAARRGYRNIY